MKKIVTMLLATLCGSGYFPIASGTIGSAVTLPFVALTAYYYGIYGIGIATFCLFFIGVYVTSIYTHGKKEHDPSSVVIDEAMGQFCTFLPIGQHLYPRLDKMTLLLYCLGFFFFRLFDTIKLQPARWADTSIHNAWGVMLDDLFAGMYASITLYVIYILFSMSTYS